MAKGEVRDISDASLASDLKKVGYIEEAKPKQPKRRKKKDDKH